MSHHNLSNIYIYILYIFIYLFIAAPDAPLRTTSAITVTTTANTGKLVIKPYIVHLVCIAYYIYLYIIRIYLFIAAPDAPMRTTSAITVTTIANTCKLVIKPYIVHLVCIAYYIYLYIIRIYLFIYSSP